MLRIHFADDGVEAMHEVAQTLLRPQRGLRKFLLADDGDHEPFVDRQHLVILLFRFRKLSYSVIDHEGPLSSCQDLPRSKPSIQPMGKAADEALVLRQALADDQARRT